MKEQITELCEGMGWFSIPSKNPWMISFKKEETNQRINVYFTTMTVTIEDIHHHQTHYRNCTLEQLEQLL